MKLSQMIADNKTAETTETQEELSLDVPAETTEEENTHTESDIVASEDDEIQAELDAIKALVS